jgi:hypothetical protein
MNEDGYPFVGKTEQWKKVTSTEVVQEKKIGDDHQLQLGATDYYSYCYSSTKRTSDTGKKAPRGWKSVAAEVCFSRRHRRQPVKNALQACHLFPK